MARGRDNRRQCARTPSGSPFRSPLWWAAFAGGLAWTLILWARAAPLASTLDDEVGHFLISRDAWAQPELILNAWGRSGTTIAFMLPAAAGLDAARAVALAMSAATVVVTTATARLLGVRMLALVPVLLWFQPWFHTYANAVLTEVPFSLAMLTACWAALAGRTALASVLFGVLPLMRHEGIAVLGMWMLFLALRRQWRQLLPAVAPLVLYHAIYSLVFWEPPLEIYLRATPTAHYGHGGWLHFAVPLVRSIGPPIALMAAAGLLLARSNRRLLLFAAPYVVYTLVHVVIFRFGLFASGGLAVFLLPVAPLAAVTAAAGAERLVAIAGKLAPRVVAPRSRAPAQVILGALVLASVAYAFRTTPAKADRAAEPMRQAVRFLEARHVDTGRVTATHVWFFALSGATVPGRDGRRSPWSHPPAPRRLGRDSVVVWDAFYSNRFGLRWSRLKASGFRVMASFGNGRVVVLQRRR